MGWIIIHEASHFKITIFGQVYSLPELSERFDHELLRTNNTRLDFEKLKLINLKLIEERISDPHRVGFV